MMQTKATVQHGNSLEWGLSLNRSSVHHRNHQPAWREGILGGIRRGGQVVAF
jgi:hypothetical protein